MKPKTEYTDTDCTSTGSLRLAQGSAVQANRRQLGPLDGQQWKAEVNNQQTALRQYNDFWS